MAASKAEFEKKIKDLEAALATTAKDNAELKQNLEKQEKSWKTLLTTAEKKLGESQENLQNITNRIGEMVKAIWGTFTEILVQILLSLHDKHYILIILFSPLTRVKGNKL